MLPTTAVFTLALACCLRATHAFTTTSSCQRSGPLAVKQPLEHLRSFHALYSSDPTDEDFDREQAPPAYNPPPQRQNSPPPVRQPRMDPLMASLTKDNSNPNQPMQTVPIFGEIPADGTLLLLAPAVLFAFGGVILGLVVAFNSADQIVDSFSTVGDSIEQTAKERTNRVYDSNVCRGICGSQSDDVDGLRNFMEAITKSAREKN